MRCCCCRQLDAMALYSMESSPHSKAFGDIQVLSKYAKPVNNFSANRLNTHEELTPKSDWEAAYEYFGNLPVLLCLLSLVFMLLHIYLALPGVRKLGLEVWCLDFPDTLGELLTAGIVVLQVEHVAKMVYRFLRARYLRGPKLS